MAKLAKMALISGSASVGLAESIAAQMNVRLIRTMSSRFSDGETRVEIDNHVRGRDAYVIQSTYFPQNDNLMELMFMADALRRSDVRSLTAVVPYMGYSRQDRRPKKERTPISARVVADMLQTVGYQRVVTVDIHAGQIQGFYNIPFISTDAATLFVADIWHKFQDPVIVSPDAGGTERARIVAKQVNADLAVIDKRRERANESQVMNVLGGVEGRTCIMLDDMVDTAGTLCKGAEALMDRGAKEVYAYCTHPVLSGKAIDTIFNSVLKQIIVTDTIPLPKMAAESGQFRVLSMAEIIAETMRRVHNSESVSLMYT